MNSEAKAEARSIERKMVDVHRTTDASTSIETSRFSLVFASSFLRSTVESASIFTGS